MKIQPVKYPANDVKAAKFVQLYITEGGESREGGERFPLLALTSEEGQRHGAILKKTLTELGLEFNVSQIPHLNSLRFPDIKSERYEVCGMGLFKFKLQERLFVAYSCSADYEIWPDEKHFQDIQAIDSAFRYEIDRAVTI